MSSHPSALLLVSLDKVINTEGNAVQVTTMGLLRASTIEHQMALRIADIDPLVIASARVCPGSRAVRRLTPLLGDGLAVRNVSDVGALAAVWAGSDLLVLHVSQM